MVTTAPTPRLSSGTAEPVPVAFLGRTSTLGLQDPVASLHRQLRSSHEVLPPGWFIAAHFWDVESGGIDLEDRSTASAHEQVDAGIPRDGGMAELLAEAASPSPRFAVVVCEDIERSARDTFNALKLERQLRDAGIPLFATDEPIHADGINATTILVRRVKQGVAEWFRLQLKEKRWKGMQEHTISGWNSGTTPYGYTAERVPHPSPAKRAEGRTKTRLALDPDRAAIVAQIFTWRVEDKLSVPTITDRLNADREAYPPPKIELWTTGSVYQILANPKYTGYMVWNRTTKPRGQRRRTNPPQAWVWSPQPSHPAIVTRELFDAAQAIAAQRGNIRDDPGPSAHPLARRAYALRGRIRCRICKRRMHGVFRSAATYYVCPHNMNDPRHAAAIPDHPTTITVREDHLIPAIAQFLAEHVLSPHRAGLLAAHLDPGQAARDEKRNRDKARLETRLRRIGTAQDALIRELETPAEPGDPAAAALRARIRARFAELETERTELQAQLHALDHDPHRPDDPTLIDELPTLTGRLDQAPPALLLALLQACDIQVLYRRDTHQATIWATITSTTPQALRAILNRSEPTTSSDLAQSLIEALSAHN